VRQVRILKGVYLCKNSIFLHSGLVLTGEGNETILRKPPPVESPIIRDVSHYERAVPVKDPDRFPVGGGIQLHGVNKLKVAQLAQHTVIARNGGELIVAKDYIGKNFWPQEGETKVTTHIPLIRGDNVQDITITRMQLDGAIPREKIENLPGCGLYLWNCRNVKVSGLYVHNNSGDGIGFEISHDVLVEDCALEANALPLHGVFAA
jgi:polygalacturonase